MSFIILLDYALGCSIMAMHLAVNQAYVGSNPTGPANIWVNTQLR